MYVCICRQITDQQIRDVCRDGGVKLADVRARLGVASECGKCGQYARTIISEFNKPVPCVNAS
ncbi:MAG: (2Fe-2S)-binding protein [Gammaproteobacteria bacterium]|nr:(2Fe-2S)-binding protein [Pseudomonadales bacterium]MCP5345750.1 (2Fe-2S)-binding protein [Pseudomonadales bacterium]